MRDALEVLLKERPAPWSVQEGLFEYAIIDAQCEVVCIIDKEPGDYADALTEVINHLSERR